MCVCLSECMFLSVHIRHRLSVIISVCLCFTSGGYRKISRRFQNRLVKSLFLVEFRSDIRIPLRNTHQSQPLMTWSHRSCTKQVPECKITVISLQVCSAMRNRFIPRARRTVHASLHSFTEIMLTIKPGMLPLTTAVMVTLSW